MKTNTPSNPGVSGRVLRSLGLVATLLVAFLAIGCGPSPESYNIPAEALAPRTKTTLSVGDVLRITYPGAPEYNQLQTIAPDGRISLPSVGTVTASGRSISSLQAGLTSSYEAYLSDPTVVIAVEQPAAAVYVAGEVNKPGKVPLTRTMTALEAVMEAGGFSRFANPKQVFVVRNQGGSQKRYALNLSDTLAGYENQAFYVRPYDVIYVKQSNW